jgi:DNA-binding Lrp family transcriptional regulator
MRLDELDRRIVGALQVDGRASWRRIAEVLDAPFSTVNRRGTALLASGTVRVVALPRYSQTAIIEVTTVPQRFDAVARALAERADTVFVFALSAPARIIVEELQPSEGALARAVLDEIPAIEGVTGVNAAPILAYYRTLSTWMPGLLTPSEVAELNPKFGRLYDDAVPLTSAADREMYEILAPDGRVSVADIAARIGQSEPAIRRRLTGLVDAAILWIRVAPADIDRIAGQILESPHVRYAAMTMGDHQLIVDVAVSTLDDLRRFLTERPWAAAVDSIRTSPVLATYKRSGLPVEER